jgi:triacylglycerol lipase
MQFSVAEFDPDDFHKQAAQLVAQWHATKGRLPEMHYLSGHNHLTPGLCIGSDHRETERMVAGFVQRVTC